MKKQENIAMREPVVWEQYKLKLDQLDILFLFVMCGFLDLSEAKRKKFVRELKLKEQKEITETMEKLRELSKSGILKDVYDEKDIQDIERSQQKKVGANYRSKTHTQYAEWV